MGELTATFDPEPAEPTSCTVEDQDEVGKVAPDTEVILFLSCSISEADLRDGAMGLARKSAMEDGGDYEVGDCFVETADQGRCEVRYFDIPGGGECEGTILVERRGDSLHSTQRDLSPCF